MFDKKPKKIEKLLLTDFSFIYFLRVYIYLKNYNFSCVLKCDNIERES